MIKIKNLLDKGEIYIYGTIVDDTDAQWILDDEGQILGYQFPTDIKAQLDELAGIPIDIHISSYGGDVSAAVTIFNMLAGHNAPVTVYIDSIAASAASLIAFAGNEIVMPENAFLMIHNPQGGGFGSAEYLMTIVDYLDKTREMIAKTYEKHVKNGADIRAMMDEETWIPAQTASEIFDNVRVVESNDIKAVAKFDVTKLSNYKNVPEAVKDMLSTKDALPADGNVDENNNVNNEVKNNILEVLKGAYRYEEKG